MTNPDIKLDLEITEEYLKVFGDTWERMRAWRESAPTPPITGEKRKAALLAVTRLNSFRTAMADLLAQEGYLHATPTTPEQCDMLLDQLGSMRRLISLQTGEDVGVWAGAELKRLMVGASNFEINQVMNYIKSLRGADAIRDSRVQTAATASEAIREATAAGE